MLRATIGVLAIAGKYDELLKALKLKAQLENVENAEEGVKKLYGTSKNNITIDFYTQINCLYQKFITINSNADGIL